MEFRAIDFETANSTRESACSVAVAKIADGKLSDSFYALIRPKDMKFNYYNIQVHGIYPEDVADKPDFAHIWQDLKKELDGKMVVAHNAAFDMSVLKACILSYGLEMPRFDYLCTVKIAKKLWPEIENHRLNTLGDYFGIRFHHHNAMDDARTCAKIAHLALQKANAADLYELGKMLNMKPTAFKL
jgi:DNA polymerase-3 subunit epsilon